MSTQDDPLRRQRNQALKRAGVALVLAGLLLVVALVLEQQGAVPERVGAGAGKGQVGMQPAASAIAVLPPTAPAPRVPAAAQPEQGGPPDPVQPAAPATDRAPEAPIVPAVPVAPLPVPQAIPPAPADGFRIQLGVFGDPANAAAYQRELAAKGLPATIQSRVVLGPFADRTAAEKAQAALRKAGHEAGMLLPPARKKP